MTTSPEPSSTDPLPMVSVVIPFHNSARFIGPTSSALRTLSPDRFEIVAIDDHSTDDTAAALAEWATRSELVRVVHAEATGVAAARNQAVAAARGDFIWFIDCDDSWDLGVLREMIEIAAETEADTVIANANMVANEDGAISVIEDAPEAELIDGEEAVRRLLQGRVQGHLWNKLFRASVVGQAPFPATRAHSDLGGMFGLLARSNRVVLLPRVLYTYVLRSGSITNASTYRWNDLTDCLRIAEQTASGISHRHATTRDLPVFTMRKVVIPLENEMIRRASTEKRSQLRTVRRANRRRINLRGIVGLLISRDYMAAAQSSMIFAIPVLYRVLYRRRRALAWRDLDVLTSR